MSNYYDTYYDAIRYSSFWNRPFTAENIDEIDEFVRSTTTTSNQTWTIEQMSDFQTYDAIKRLLKEYGAEYKTLAGKWEHEIKKPISAKDLNK
jgi:low affinity Fe/Cu permease